MAGHVAVEEALARYEQNLGGLTFNCKPLIDNLTRAADQLKSEGEKIVEMIQKRIMKVRPEWKLPSLYLLDSIMKNLKGVYLEHVNQVIVSVFCHCFEKLTDPDLRKLLYKLRTTWPPYLSKHKLATLDKHVHALDPKWPITANDSPTNTIFVNPKFVQQQEMPQTMTTSTSIEDRRKAVLQETKIQRQEQERVMGLSGLSTKSEDCSSDDTISEQSKQHDFPTQFPQDLGSHAHSSSPVLTNSTSKSASPPHSHNTSGASVSKPSTSGMVAPPEAKRIRMDGHAIKEPSATLIKEAHLRLDDIPPELLPVHQEKVRERIERQINAGNLTPEQRTTLVGQLNQLYELQKQKIDHNPSQSQHGPIFSSHTATQPPGTNPELNAPLRGQLPGRFESHQRPYRARGHTQMEKHTHPWPLELSQGTSSAQQLPVRDLIKELVKEGLMEDGQSMLVTRVKEPGARPLKIPNLALTPATLKQRYNSVIDLLHNGMPCSSCGLRFLDNSYESHLNWHYRANREDKDHQRTSRNWFIHPDDWIKYEELAEDSTVSGITIDQVQVKDSPATVPTSEASIECQQEMESSSVEAGDSGEVCMVCNEPFEQFWKEDEESWHFRDAMRINPGGKLCHIFCYKDID